MDATDILEAVSRMEKALADRGFARPDVGMRVTTNADPFTLIVRFEKGPNLIGEAGVTRDEFKFFRAETPDQAIADGDAYLASLESPEARHREDFIAAVNKLIDRGREFGITDDLIAPLVDGRDIIAERLLTYSPEGA